MAVDDLNQNGDRGRSDIAAIKSCQRCSVQDGTLQIRSEAVCQNCFLLYVNTKAVKRMETYRPKGAAAKKPMKFLLPLSFGVSSLSLLHILDTHIKIQLDRMLRSSYDLFVVFVQTESPLPADAYAKVEAYFPRHSFSKVLLSDVLKIKDIDWQAFGISSTPEGLSDISSSEKLQLLLDSLPSSTSRADVVNILLTRLLVDIAITAHCDGILFGDTTTRLAEKTLAETAKGRGFSLPWQVADNTSPYGIRFQYPIRDLLKKEVVLFSELAMPELQDMILRPAKTTLLSAKSTTIDDLMIQYFGSVEENYPSIVANVVRTSSKLQPSHTDAAVQDCGCCGLPVAEGEGNIHGWAGDQKFTSHAEIEAKGPFLCYGCSRSING